MYKRTINNFSKCLTRKKKFNLTEEEQNSNGLDRCLGKIDLLSYGIGSCVGAGVFVTTGTIAANNSGPATFLSYILSGFAAMLSGLCYAEFAARMPIAGSAYVYTYATLGEFMAWVIGWNLTLEYGISCGTLAVSWSSYLQNLFATFGIKFPIGLSPYPINSVFELDALAVFIVLVCSVISMYGCNLSSKFNIFLTAWNVFIIVFVIIYGSIFVKTENFTPFVPFGFEGIISGAGVAFFSYVGFDAVSSLSAETRNPQKDIPIGLLGSLGIVILLYSAISLIVVGMVPLGVLKQPNFINAPISEAFVYVGVNWAATLVAFGSVTSLTCNTLCSMLGQPRIFLAMSQDGLLFKSFGKLNKRQIPANATIITTILAGVLGFLFKFEFLSNCVSMGTLSAFTVVCISTLFARICPPGSWIFWMLSRHCHIASAGLIPLGVLLFAVPALFIVIVYEAQVRRNNVGVLDGTFKCPGMPFVPLLGIFINSGLIAGLSAQAYINLAVWTGIGLCIYFCYGIRHSKLSKNSHVIVPTSGLCSLASEPLLSAQPSNRIIRSYSSIPTVINNYNN